MNQKSKGEFLCVLRSDSSSEMRSLAAFCSVMRERFWMHFVWYQLDLVDIPTQKTKKLAEKLLSLYDKLGCSMFLQLHFLHSCLDLIPWHQRRDWRWTRRTPLSSGYHNNGEKVSGQVAQFHVDWLLLSINKRWHWATVQAAGKETSNIEVYIQRYTIGYIVIFYLVNDCCKFLINNSQFCIVIATFMLRTPTFIKNDQFYKYGMVFFFVFLFFCPIEKKSQGRVFVGCHFGIPIYLGHLKIR